MEIAKDKKSEIPQEANVLVLSTIGLTPEQEAVFESVRAQSGGNDALAAQVMHAHTSSANILSETSFKADATLQAMKK